MSSPGGPDVDWRQFAACRREDPELFFPGGNQDQLAEAIRVCRRCPVRAECLRWAAETGQRHGVWGGVMTGDLQPICGKWLNDYDLGRDREQPDRLCHRRPGHNPPHMSWDAMERNRQNCAARRARLKAARARGRG